MKPHIIEHATLDVLVKEIKRLEAVETDLRNRLALSIAERIGRVIKRETP